MRENIEETRSWAKYRARQASLAAKETICKKERKIEL
jgi:hypothetical protein